ncbi:MAG: toxin HipA [Cytophagia bacterium]|nr:toxin HipA [Cytophagia bacterium]
MRKAAVMVNDILAGILLETDQGYEFEYEVDYSGDPVSLTMPTKGKKFIYKTFPPFFDGLLPEGQQLEGLLRQHKFDRSDYFSQLCAVGNDLVGAVTVKEIK